MVSKSTLKEFRRVGLSDLEIAVRLNQAAGEKKITPQDVFKARRQYDLLTNQEREQIRQGRRTLTKAGVGAGLALGAVGAGGIIYHLTRPHGEYKEAIIHKEKRAAWIKNTFKNLPDYVKPVYANDKLAAEVSQSIGQRLDPIGAYASTLRDDMGKLPGNGNRSTMYFLNEAFLPLFLGNPDTLHDLEIIIINTGYRHEKTHADHFYYGIPKYLTENFFRNDGQFNSSLFLTVTEILAHAEEYKGLKENLHRARSDFYQFYMDEHAKKGAMAYYRQLFSSRVVAGTDTKFIEQLRTDFNPANLGLN